MNSRAGAYAQLTAAMILVGSSVVAAKLIVATIPPFIAGAGRFAIATALLVPLLLLREGRPPALPRRDWAILVLQAFTGIFLFYLLLLLGLRLTTATEAGVITGTTPAVTALLSVLLLRERAGPLRWVGIGLAALGAIAASIPVGASAPTDAAASLLGNLLVFGAVCGESSFTLGSKAISSRATPLFNATAVSAIGLFLFLPPALIEARGFAFDAVPLSGWLTVVYTGTVVTVLAFNLWFSGVVRVPASVAAGFTGVLPTSAILLSALVLREPLTIQHLIGVAAVILGLFLLTRGESGRSGMGGPVGQ